MEPTPRSVNLPRPAAALALLGVLLGGCSWLPSVPGATLFDSPRQLRGHLVEDETLAQVTVGVSSRQDVETLLGSPSSTGTFDDSIWYYMSSITRQRPARTLSVQDQRVVSIRFDGRGVVQDIRKLGQEDARDVPVVARITESPGNDRTILQQLFGNLGRLTPGVGGAAQPQGPGVPSGNR